MCIRDRKGTVLTGAGDQRANLVQEHPSPNDTGWRIRQKYRLETRGHREVHGISLSEMIWWEVGAIIGVTRVGISKEIKTVYARGRALSASEFLTQFI